MTLTPEDRARLDVLKEKAEVKRAAAFAERKRKSDEHLARSAARSERRIAKMRRDYFKEREARQ